MLKFNFINIALLKTGAVIGRQCNFLLKFYGYT